MMKPNIEEKLSRTVSELKKLCVLSEIKLEEIFISSEVDLSDLNSLPKHHIHWEKMENPCVFQEPRKYYWIKSSFDIAKKEEHTKTFLSLAFGIKNRSITIRPQGLLYLNNKIIQGIDIMHE